jgi:DNA-binding response OmpR family regulator
MSPAVPTLKGKRILLVEDDPTLAPFLQMVLSESGAEVKVVLDPAHAPDELKALGSLDVLVTDVVLPGKSGFQLAAEISAAHPKARVLFMSGFGDPEIGARDLLAPFDTLLKPFLPEDFTAKVLGLLR